MTVTTDCSKDPRKALIEAGVDVFSRLGYDGATTRMIAKTAGVNLAAIPYYFGSKEDLYQATIRWIVDTIIGDVVEKIKRPHEAVDCDSLDEAALVDLAVAHLETFADGILRQNNAAVKLILAREQILPTSAFVIIHERMGAPLFGIFAQILARLMRKDPDDAEVVVQVHAIMSQAVFFTVGRKSLLTHLRTETLTEDHLATIIKTLRENTRTVLNALGTHREPKI